MSARKKILYGFASILLVSLTLSSILSVVRLNAIAKRTLRMEADIGNLEESITKQNHEAAFLQRASGHLVTATAYNATAAQCGSSDGITATGTRVKQGRTIAVSRDLLKKYSLKGKRVLIPGLGVRIVEDVMHKKMRNSIDVYFKDKAAAKQFGSRDVILIPLE